MTSLAILFSHHILSTKKKKAIKSLPSLFPPTPTPTLTPPSPTPSLTRPRHHPGPPRSLTVLLKSGAPGFIVLEGSRDQVSDATRFVMRMQWQYITTLLHLPSIDSLPPLPSPSSSSSTRTSGSSSSSRARGSGVRSGRGTHESIEIRGNRNLDGVEQRGSDGGGGDSGGGEGGLARQIDAYDNECVSRGRGFLELGKLGMLGKLMTGAGYQAHYKAALGK